MIVVARVLIPLDEGHIRRAIAIDIGGTKIAAGLIDSRGRILASRHIDSPSATSAGMVEAINGSIEEMMASAGSDDEVVGIGLAVAGTIDFERFGRPPRNEAPMIYLSPNALLERLAEEYVYAQLCELCDSACI